MPKFVLLFIVILGSYIKVYAQNQKPLPIIDMHLHALGASDQGPAPLTIGAPFKNFGYHDPKDEYVNTFMNAFKTGAWTDHPITSPTTDDSIQLLSLAILKKRNIYAVCSGSIEKVRKWKAAAPDRIINGLMWHFADVKEQGLNVDSCTRLFKSGEFKVFGEITIQYEGISPSDSAFEAYLKMAESLDIPVGIHVGPGPPGAIYLGASNYRARLHSPLVLEEMLVRHPRLRVYAMHAGWPMMDDMIAMLYAHPQLYVDLGVISYILPKKEFYRYLQRLVETGFIKRIMFGSDQMEWPQAIEVAIDNIQQADFLSEEEKRDILFNNAARFLRLTDKQIKEMQ
jgi:predicted TIM-barrel fold metal-dependent hydrolase